jgi:hypothetical protein
MHCIDATDGLPKTGDPRGAGGSSRPRRPDTTRAPLRGKKWFVLLGCLALAACDPEYAYVPTSNPTAVVSGHVAADYGVPPEAPCGDVRVASSGFSRVPLDGQSESVTDDHPLTLHLRLLVRNESATPWTIEAGAQRVEFEGFGSIAPSFAVADRSSASSPRTVTVFPGTRRSLDLYYFVPDELAEDAEESIPLFVASWQMKVGQRKVHGQTMFERLRVGSADSYAALYRPGVGWGEANWDNPLGGTCENPYRENPYEDDNPYGQN